jgi:hypothetical protein
VGSAIDESAIFKLVRKVDCWIFRSQLTTLECIASETSFAITASSLVIFFVSDKGKHPLPETKKPTPSSLCSLYEAFTRTDLIRKG